MPRTFIFSMASKSLFSLLPVNCSFFSVSFSPQSAIFSLAFCLNVLEAGDSGDCAGADSGDYAGAAKADSGDSDACDCVCAGDSCDMLKMLLYYILPQE